MDHARQRSRPCVIASGRALSDELLHVGLSKNQYSKTEKLPIFQTHYIPCMLVAMLLLPGALFLGTLIGVAYGDTVDISLDDRLRYVEYLQLSRWILCNETDRSKDVPNRYRVIEQGDRWALLNPPESDECVLMNRGTFTEREAKEDLAAYSSGAVNVKGIQCNRAMYESYLDFSQAQESALARARSQGKCRGNPILFGHSLGATTILMATIALGQPIHEVVLFAPIRALLIPPHTNRKTCRPVLNLVDTKIRRFNRGETGYHDVRTLFDFNNTDIVGAWPVPHEKLNLTWGHCAHQHVKIASKGMTSGFTGLENVGAEYPPAGILDLKDYRSWASGSTTPWHHPEYYWEGLNASISPNGCNRETWDGVFMLFWLAFIHVELFY